MAEAYLVGAPPVFSARRAVPMNELMTVPPTSTADLPVTHLLLRHAALPALAPLALLALSLTPLTVIGCRDRGLLALAVVAVSTVAALICAVLALRAGVRAGGSGVWWALSAAVLALPAALLLGPLG